MLRNDLKLYFAGGSGSSSLGGSKQLTSPQDKSWTPTDPIGGISVVTVDGAAPTGTAELYYINSATTLQWKSNGNDYGPAVDISGAAIYDIIDSAGYYISVSVTSGGLPSTDTTASFTISDVLDSLFDTVTKTEAINGDTEYRAVYFSNDVDTESDYLLSPQLYIISEQDTIDSGTATGGSSTTLEDTGKSWASNAYAHYFVRIIDGTGAGQSREISSNTSTELTVSTAWDTTPSTDSVYQISSSLLDFGFEDIYYEESVGTGDGSTTSFSGTLANAPVNSAQIEITDGTETFTDWDGDGNLTGDAGGTGTITYSSGAWSVTFNAAPANGAAITAYYTKEIQAVADESTAPSGITFVHPVESAKLNLYSAYNYIRGKGFSQGIWLRRKVYRAFDSSTKYQFTITGSY